MRRIGYFPCSCVQCKEASDLTDYAVVFRYLDAPREPDESEATVVLETAARAFSCKSVLAWRRPGHPENRLGPPLPD